MDTMTVKDFCYGALAEIGVKGLSQTPDGAVLDLAITYLRLVQSEMQADRLALSAVGRTEYALVANQRDYTIGPGGNFDGQRPRWVPFITVIPAGDTAELNVTPFTHRNEWLAEPYKDLTDLYPYRFLYERTAPLGTLTFWPVPKAPAAIWLATPIALDTITDANTVLTFDDGYWPAWHFAMAKRLCRPFSRPLTDDILRDAMSTMAVVHALNIEAPPRSPSPLVGNGRFDIYTNRNRGT